MRTPCSMKMKSFSLREQSRMNPAQVGLILCLGKMRICRVEAAKWRRGAGLGFLSQPLRWSAFPSETWPDSSLSRIGIEVRSAQVVDFGVAGVGVSG